MTLAAAVLCLWLTLVLPGHPGALAPAALLRFPGELPVILLALAAAPGRTGRLGVRLAVTTFLLVTTAAKLADLAGYTAFLRPFDPVLDRHLIASAWELLQGAIGPGKAIAAAAAAVAALAITAAAVWWATGRVAAAGTGRRRVAGAGLAVAVALAAGGLSPGEPVTTRLAVEHLKSAGAARRDIAQLTRDAANDPLAGQRLQGLAGTDVAVIFIESYGRTALTHPRYAPGTEAALAAAQADLAARGLAMRSAWLTSPIAGGQSWLAHATLLAGLRIDSEGRYRALIASPRLTLPALAAASGWQAVAVAPAITRAWPEAAYFGFARVLDAEALGYRGADFGWVTMPDQYTLSVLARLLSERPRAAVFAQVALISSHAPWTPIPPMISWDGIGDGRVFDTRMTAGEAPEILWRDPDRVRAQYGASIAYAVSATTGFLARQAASPALVIVLGDHQPAAFVAEGYGGRDVPVHVIGPPDLVARLDPWGWTMGLRPGPGAPVWPMEAFRDRFLTAFADPAPAPGMSPLPSAASR